ncbi:DUF342 domain-containing protein [bacterium]|nr:DUF342 domain-containing protein [bacterium]
MPYRVTQLFRKDPNSEPDSDSTVDHYRSDITESVTCDQPLASLQLVPPDTPLSPAHQKSLDDFVIEKKTDLISATVELTEKSGELLVISKKNGFPSIVNNQIVVYEQLVIDGDINFHTGNIECPGDLLVKGSIMSGFKVKAKNLTVNGSIENAEVVCQGNLICRGGIVACNDFPLSCGGSLWAKYIENSNLEVKNNLFISGSSLHSSFKVTGSIILCHDKAILVGGKCEAGHSLYSGVVGAKWATPTEIILGCNPFLEQKFKNHCQYLEKIDTELDEIRTRVEQINTYLQHEEGQTTTKEAHKLQEERALLESKSNFTTQKHKNALRERDKLEDQIEKFKKSNANAILYVANHLFSGVSLTIKDAKAVIEEECRGVTILSDDEGEIKIESILKN